MFKRWFVLAVVAVALAAPATARAEGTWAWPVSGDPALVYGGRYTDAAGKGCTHGGLDISATAGDTVRSCAAGGVAFCGPVPAGEGARVWAVTILTADGLRVTYMPLDFAVVHRGQNVDAGTRLGDLAGSGDPSAAEAHLHLSVKRGGRALDPAAFLGPRTTVAPPAPAAPVAPAAPKGGRVNAPAPKPSAVHSAAGTGARVPVEAHVPAGAGAPSFAPTVSGALKTLTQAPPIARAEPIAAPTTVSLAKMGSDVSAGRALLLTWAVRIGLILLSCAAAWPVLRGARSAAASPVAEPAQHRAR